MVGSLFSHFRLPCLENENIWKVILVLELEDERIVKGSGFNW